MGSKTASFESELTYRLKSAGITSVEIRCETESDDYYFCQIEDPNTYLEFGTTQLGRPKARVVPLDFPTEGSPHWTARHLTSAEAEAFVSGLIAGRRFAW